MASASNRAVNRLEGSAHGSFTTRTRARCIRSAAAPHAGSSDTGMCPGVATDVQVDGRRACRRLGIPGKANPSSRGAANVRGLHPPPTSAPPSPRTRVLRSRECVDKVHDLASPKLSHGTSAGLMTHYKPGIPTIACRLDLEIGAIFTGAVVYLFHAA